MRMGAEERGDAATGVEGGWLVVADAGETLGLEADALVIVHERMSGIRVFLHVVDDESTFEQALKLVGDTLVPAVLRAIWRRSARRQQPYVECGVGSIMESEGSGWKPIRIGKYFHYRA
jgi:hypothetical protein